MARTVTPMKYWGRRDVARVHIVRGDRKESKRAQMNGKPTWEMLGWLRMGWMCSVARSAQADMSTVATMRMSRDLHRDQWTTAPWLLVSVQIQKLKCKYYRCEHLSLLVNYIQYFFFTLLFPGNGRQV